MMVYIKGKEHGKLLVNLIINGPFQYGTIVEPGNESTLATVRERTYNDLTNEEKIRESVDIKATNIVLQRLPQDIYNGLFIIKMQSRFGIQSNYSFKGQSYHCKSDSLSSFQTNDLDAFDSDCNNVPLAKAVLMANLSSYDSDVLLQNNRDAHIDYLKVTQEHTDMLWGILEQVRALKPFDNALDYVCYGDYHLGNATISRVYYVDGLGQNLFFVGSRDTNLYTISLDDMLKSSLICLLSKSSKTKSWLWHRRLSHLNCGTLNQLAKQGLVRGLLKIKFKKDHLCSTCARRKSKKSSHKPKANDTNQEKLYILHMDLYGPMRVESINGKKYILVFIDDYSRFTWVKFLRSKDEAPEVIIKCLKQIQVCMNATVRNIRTENETEFMNQTLKDYYENVSISHHICCAYYTTEQRCRKMHTLMEVACTIISSTKYYKDESCWNADVKSKTTEDFISNRSFMEVLVLNHYVLVKNVL
nr:hypothetical protein [Tanacetum cinerariifolium]